MPYLTREKVNSYKTGVTQGRVPDDLYIRDVPDFIPTMRRTDTPMLTMMKRGGSRDLIKWEWGEGDLVGRDDTLYAAITSNSQSPISVSNAGRYQVYDIIKIGDELLQVTAISQTGTNAYGDLTVKRGWGGTTAAASVANGSAVMILGPAVPEGADAVPSPIQKGDVFYNVPQILEYSWTFTHRGRVIPNYEVKTDQFKAELKKKMKEAALDLDRILLWGQRNDGDGTGSVNSGTPASTNASAMGGLKQFTTAYTTGLSSAPLDLNDLMEQLEDVYKDVGQADMGKTIMGSMFTKRIFNSWFQPSRRTTKSDESLKIYWSEVETDFGTLKFFTHYDMPDNELYVWNPDDCEILNFEGGNWSTGLYSTQGWYDKGFLRGDFGAIWPGNRRRCRIYGYSTNVADYPNLDVPA